jgi:hypothetical protein|tara:strand:+ start:1751 stop:2584 length:834 start_codon:yes stop_codon:yes gene_type:complete
MSVFKNLGGGHAIEPVNVFASQSFEWTSGSSALDGFSINLAKDPTVDYTVYPIGTGDLGGQTNGGLYSYPLFKSLVQVFYDISSSSTQEQFYPSHSLFVWNVGNNYVGNKIRENSFKVEFSGSSNTIEDDGKGRLKLNKTGSVVGNVFYDFGLATVQRNVTASNASLISADGVSIQSASVVTTTYQSTINIHEHTVACVVSPSEYNNTVNPSAFSTISSGSNQTYNNYINSGSVQPFISSIGLYNDQNELLAVAKLSNPILRTRFTDQTFVVKFDEP